MQMLTLEEALAGLEFPKEIRDSLTLITVPYHSFEGEALKGQLVLHKQLAEDARAIFAELANIAFPIKQIVPMVAYGWDDETSMQDNNTSAFNYREVYGGAGLSHHSLGRAIDINPLFNPYIARDGSVHPQGAIRDISRAGTFLDGTSEVEAFLSRGWEWGGHWTDRTDWQHFQKLP